MSYTNFKPEIWSKSVQVAKEKALVWRDICNTNYQGEVGRGKTVNIIGATRPTVRKYTPGSDINAPEAPADSTQKLVVDQFDYYNVVVDDVDQAQADVNIMKVNTSEGGKALAETEDMYIATVAGGASNKVTKTSAITTSAKAKEAIDEAFVKLWEANVGLNEETFVVMPPWFYNLFKNSMQEIYTNNVEMMKSGVIGMYNGAKIKLTNNIYNDETYDSIIVCNKNAITLADGIDEVSAYRPEKQFADAVKALNCYGAKIVRPAEIVNLQVKNA